MRAELRILPTADNALTGWRIALVKASFIALFLLLSPLYYLNRWDFLRHKKRNPFYTSKLVRLQERFPLLYEAAMLVQNFPAWHHVYDVLPDLAGNVLQVGCGTGLLNKHFQHRPDIRLVNMDVNLNALRVGRRLGRYRDYVQGAIDKTTPLPAGTFDVVLFARSFHHVRNHKRAFVECARLLRAGGTVIIVDPVMLAEPTNAARHGGYMANSSIDGVIWRFTRESFLEHVRASLPPTLSIRAVQCVRQPHVTNYNLFVPQTDVVAVLMRGSHDSAGQDCSADLTSQG